MRRRGRIGSAVLAAAVIAATGCGSAVPATSGGARSATIGEGITGPATLRAGLYASGIPDVAALTFDSQGRLWAASAAYTDSGTDVLDVVAHAGASPVRVLSNQHTVLGLVWLGGWLYVASAARVDAYAGFTGHGFSQHRTVLTLPTGVGEVNTLAVAPSGRLLLGISAPCDHCTPALTDSASILSFTSSGSDVSVDASHIRAPVGLTFYPGTDNLLVTMNQRDDLGNATPGDWLALVRSGSDWGAPACYGQATAACAGRPGPLAVLDKHGAVSDVVVVTGQLGARVGTAALVAEWATGRVEMVPLTDAGTRAGTPQLLLSGVGQPVALALAPDGSLLVGDWRSGRIYRISETA